jgi:hypothetical protein
MLLLETDLFFELAIKRLFRRLILFDSALRELPRTLSYTLSPEQLPFRVTYYDTDIESEAVGVNHVSITLLEFRSLIVSQIEAIDQLRHTRSYKIYLTNTDR